MITNSDIFFCKTKIFFKILSSHTKILIHFCAFFVVFYPKFIKDRKALEARIGKLLKQGFRKGLEALKCWLLKAS